MELITEPMFFDKTWYGCCAKCGAVGSAKKGELTIVFGDRRTGRETSAWADCPLCRSRRSICFYEEGTESGERERRKVQACEI